ncbi:uncharacterized protein LOC123553796 isoform X2 [Mercenaria mercenaria]|uniref:uncharacterized protein LOC123553796 isoform X2 n=1 Tax=Mercenaria mercenaria TaxID=6596 RepID=UPI00234F1E15|nr:uncharacterized protein LOC123553796 isoform X2 [Mercenaria mercenaria]
MDTTEATVTKAKGIATISSTTATATKGVTATTNILRAETPTTVATTTLSTTGLLWQQQRMALQQLLQKVKQKEIGQNVHLPQGYVRPLTSLNQIRQNIHLPQGYVRPLTSLNQIRQNIHLQQGHARPGTSQHQVRQNVHLQQGHARPGTSQHQVGQNVHLQQGHARPGTSQHQVGQNVHLQQGHARPGTSQHQIRQNAHSQQSHKIPVAIPQQSFLNANNNSMKDQIKQNLLEMKAVEEYRKRLAILKNRPSYASCIQSLENCDHTGSVRDQSSADAPSHTSLKTGSEMQKITLSNVILEGGGQFEEGQAYVIRDRYGSRKTMVFQNGELLSHSKDVGLPGSEMQKITLSNVTLEGGGQFEEGQAYVIRDRYGSRKTMVFRNGDLRSYSKDIGLQGSGQRGGGASSSQNSGVGCGQNRSHFNTTSDHTATNVESDSDIETCRVTKRPRLLAYNSDSDDDSVIKTKSQSRSRSRSGSRSRSRSRSSSVNRSRPRSASRASESDVESGSSGSDSEEGFAHFLQSRLLSGSRSRSRSGSRSRSISRNRSTSRSRSRSRSVNRSRSSSPSISSSEIVKLVLSMGYDKKLVNTVVLQHRTLAGAEMTDLNELIDAVERERCQQETVSMDISSRTGAAGSSQTSKHGKNVPTSCASSIENEYQQLKDQRLCKICMELDIEITFTPCGHFISCEPCGKPLKQCPICRQSVKSYLKTYMS